MHWKAMARELLDCFYTPIKCSNSILQVPPPAYTHSRAARKRLMKVTDSRSFTNFDTFSRKACN